MKKKYTKKQITEAIAYWKKQLKAGNYKKIDESFPIACSNDNTGIMCYTHIYSAYNNGDEDWLFVAPNMNAFIDGFVETANNEYDECVAECKANNVSSSVIDFCIRENCGRLK